VPNVARRRQTGKRVGGVSSGAAQVRRAGSAALAHPEEVVVQAIVRLFAGFRLAVPVVVLNLVQGSNRSAQVRAKSAVRVRFPMIVHRVFPSFVHK
jgi:hypothetical protein